MVRSARVLVEHLIVGAEGRVYRQRIVGTLEHIGGGSISKVGGHKVRKNVRREASEKMFVCAPDLACAPSLVGTGGHSHVDCSTH